MDISQKILSDITHHMKYARFMKEEFRREQYEDTVERNMQMHIKKFPELEEEIRSAYKLVFERKVLPSMRSMQFGGRAIEVNPTRIFNCAFTAVDDPRVFAEIMFLLLGGTGVGYSVQRHHVEKLPEIHKPNPKKTRRFLVGDSIEGWADAMKALMRSYFEGGSRIVFDFSDIRPKGARLITAGGKAPGPQPLKEMLIKVEGVLDAKQNGDKLQPIEVHDIVCYIADAVLAGGIRRSALICLFSADDNDMIAAKSGAWWEEHPQRGRANNSAVILRHRVTKEYFLDLWDRIKSSGAGEPGIFFTNDKEWGTNPCAEIALRSNQFCVSGDTKLITKDGIVNIKDAVGTKIDIWNGKEWSEVEPYKTGDNDRLHRVWFNDGTYLDATDNHKFLVKNRFEKEFKEVETLDLINLVKDTKYQLQIPRANIEYNFGVEQPLAFEYGFILGDGFVDGKRVKTNLYNEDKKIPFKNTKVIGNYINYNGTTYTTIQFDVDEEFARKLKYEQGLPREVFSWNKKSIIDFISGWIDADGCAASKGIRLYGAHDKLADAQLLLTKCGIDSSLNLMQKAGVETNLGIRKNDVWYLQITKTSDLKTQRVKVINESGAKHKGKYQIIKKIDTLDGLHESFCLTEDKLHQCVFNNVLTKQCNLCEVNASDLESQEDFEERVKSAAFIGTLQASYTDFHYLRDVWRRVTEKEALLGIGMTGIASNVVQKLDMEKAAKLAVEENKRVAKLLGINPAARVTTVKPSGTTSLILGTSSGVHAWHNDFYIRRIRVGKNEAIYSYLKNTHPELVEDEFFRPHDTAVISVPQKAPEGAVLRTETAIQMLERVKDIHDRWVKPGHVKGQNTHNVSATVSVKDNEWVEVGEWMWENRDSYTGLSVLPYDTGTYKQTPFEDCTKEEFERLFETLKNVDLGQIFETDDETDLKGELACTGPDGCAVV